MEDIKKKVTKVKENKEKVKSKYGDLIQKIAGLKVVELNDFIKELQDYFQVDPATLIASQSSQDSSVAKKNKELFDLVLTETGQSKVVVIKIIAKITEKGLLEAKKMLDNLPLTLFSQKPEVELTKVQKELQDAGAVVEIK